jgi:hypothetical protein
MNARLPAIWDALRLLLVKTDDVHDLLVSAFDDLEWEFKNNSQPESVEFAPYVLDILTKNQKKDLTTESLIETLRTYSHTAAARTVIREELLKALEIKLASHSVQAILLKGAALHRYIYPESCFRLGLDVDILIRVDDYSHIGDVLKGLANEVEKYQTSSSIKDLSVERLFISVTPPFVSLDIHRELTTPYIYPIDYDGLFRRSLSHPAYNNNVLRVLSPEDNLIHFAIHSLYDLKLFSKQTLDAYLLLQHESINWALLLRLAKEYRVVKPLMYLLEGVSYVFGYNPPDEVKNQINLNIIHKWLVYKILVRKVDERNMSSWRSRLRQLLSQWFLSGNLTGVLKYQMRYVKARLIDYYLSLNLAIR